MNGNIFHSNAHFCHILQLYIYNAELALYILNDPPLYGVIIFEHEN